MERSRLLIGRGGMIHKLHDIAPTFQRDAQAVAGSVNGGLPIEQDNTERNSSKIWILRELEGAHRNPHDV